MTYARLRAPTLADFDVMARSAVADVPETFRQHFGGLVVRVADFAPRSVLDELGIRDPLELTGLYDGTALPDQSTWDSPSLPPTIWLYRRPILAEWMARGDVELGHLIKHVLVHEVAHHFGYSDDDIAAIDDWRL